MFRIFISRSTARWLSSIVIGRNCSRESLQTAVQPYVARRQKIPLSATTFKTYIGPFL